MISMPFFIFFISAIVICFIKLLKKNHDFFEKRNIKYIQPYPLIGTNTWLLQKKILAYDMLEKCKKFKNEKVFGLFDFLNPALVINHPDLIKQITVKDFDHFTDRRTFFNNKTNNVTKNLLITLKGKKWHEMRTSLTPIFTSSKMRLMFELISHCGKQLIGNLKVDNERYQGSKSYDMKDICTKFACDVIASCAFGYQSDSYRDPDNEFYDLGKSLLEFRTPKMLLKLLFIRFSPKFANFIGITLFKKEAAVTFYNMIVKSIDEREKTPDSRPDLVNLLAHLKKGNSIAEEDGKEGAKASDGKRTWNNDELVAQCYVFFFAGFETVSSLLIFATYELAVNPDIQSKLRKEIVEVQEKLGHEKSVTYEAIQGMKYLEMIISEALRKWPPAAMLDRVCTKEYKCETDGLKLIIDEGDLLWIPVYSVHHNPEYYPNPEKFDPERFSDENKPNISSNTYLPFGIGPRNCIGSRFALLEIKTLLFYLVSNFRLEISKETDVPVKLKGSVLSMSPAKPIMLHLKSLNN